MEKAHEKFLQEAEELIDDLERAVLSLEKAPEDKNQTEEVFRVMHTFKGTAKMFGYDLIGDFTHFLENIFDDIRGGKLKLSNDILDISLKSVDHIRTLLTNRGAEDKSLLKYHQAMIDQVKTFCKAENDPTSASFESNHAKITIGTLFLIHFKPQKGLLKSGNNPLFILEDLSALGEMYIKTNTGNLPDLDNYVADEVYLSWELLLFTDSDENDIRNEFIFIEDLCEIQIEEIVQENLLTDSSFLTFLKEYPENLSEEVITRFISKNKIAASEKTSVKGDIGGSSNSNQTIKVTYEKIDNLMGIVSELVTTQARLSLYTDTNRNQELEEITENIEKLVRQLRDESFSISLLPVSNLKTRFERLVRDTSRELSKKVRFISKGGETELDKKIIEKLADPLLHMLRNSMDHGIELPHERIKKGKDETGTIQLNSYYAGSNVVIEIHDDGKGIDKNAVFKKAVQKGIIKPTDELSEKEVFDLLFSPGFSTTEKVTDVSGRGVGMDVVKRSINQLRGEIEVQSKINEGTLMRLRLPLSLSIIDGLLVALEKTQYIIPLAVIDKCYEMESKEIKPDMNDLIVLDGEQVPYVSLREVFDEQKAKPQFVNLVVTRHENKKIAIEVDNIIDEYQAVVKPLGKMYKNQDFASGATILGNGSVALVLDVSRLMHALDCS